MDAHPVLWRRGVQVMASRRCTPARRRSAGGGSPKCSVRGGVASGGVASGRRRSVAGWRIGMVSVYGVASNGVNLVGGVASVGGVYIRCGVVSVPWRCICWRRRVSRAVSVGAWCQWVA
jgi:hypothetical protein